MIGFIKGWITSVVSAVIFMVLVDMILPSNSFKKYSKLVTGLIVIITILTPIFKLFDKNISVETYIEQYADEMSSYSNAKEMSSVKERVDKQTIMEFKNNLISTIENEINLSAGKKYIVSELKINEDRNSYGFTEVMEIKLKKYDKQDTVKPVENVVIGKGQKSENIPRDEGVINLLNNKFNINPDVVKFVK